MRQKAISSAGAPGSVLMASRTRRGLEAKATMETGNSNSAPGRDRSGRFMLLFGRLDFS